MSKMLDIGVVVTFEEKGTWAYLTGALIVPAIYFVHVLGQLGQTPVTEIAWVRPMLTAIGVGIVAGIAAHLLIAMTKPGDAGRRDVRDRDISRFGDLVGGIVLSGMAAGVLVLTMFEAEHFWIANGLYAAFVIQAISSSIVKLVAYRRGL